MSRQKERREFDRRDCLMRCRCEGEGFRFDGYIVDISHGGAGVKKMQKSRKKLLAEDNELLVTTLLPWKTIELRSRVVWTESQVHEPGLAEFGVEFVDTLYQRQHKLAEFFPKSDTI